MARSFRRRPHPAWLTVLLVLAVLSLRLWRGEDRNPRSPNSLETLSEGLYRVTRVVDGDTLIVAQPTEAEKGAESRDGRRQARIRLLSVDTPESVKPGFPVEPWGKEATQFTRQFVAAGEVHLRFDRRRIDQYDRFLAYVYVGDQMLNEELVRAGLARVRIYPGDSASIGRRLRRAEEQAKKERRRIWSNMPPEGL